MAFPIQLTLVTGNKVTANYQSQEVSVSVTYQLERGDTDVVALAREKAPELISAHQATWQQVRGEADSAGEKSASTKAAVSEGIHANYTTETMEVHSTSNPGEQPSEPKNDSDSDISTSLVSPLSGVQLNALEALLAQAGWSQTQLEEHLLQEFGKAELTELTSAEAGQLLLELQRTIREQTQARSQARRANTVSHNGHRS